MLAFQVFSFYSVKHKFTKSKCSAVWLQQDCTVTKSVIGTHGQVQLYLELLTFTLHSNKQTHNLYAIIFKRNSTNLTVWLQQSRLCTVTQSLIGAHDRVQSCLEFVRRITRWGQQSFLSMLMSKCLMPLRLWQGPRKV